jgi:nucleotide-binding universal stress UspA family protein
MRRIAVVPAAAMNRVAGLLQSAGWEAVPASRGAEDPDEAVEVARGGEPALYVPDAARPAPALRKILVVHEGSRESQASMDLADEAAVAAGAGIVVLYAAPSNPSTTSASLPFRIADHGSYDWNEWRDEFLRRFCRCSPGVEVALRVTAGGTGTLLGQVRGEAADLVIVLGPPDGEAEHEGEGGEALDAAIEGNAPILIVPASGRDRATMEAAELGQRRS